MLIPYTFRFVTIDANGNEIEIAEAVTGSDFAGVTKTEHAKTGMELYPDWRDEGYFPNTASHSLVLDVSMAETGMEYTFIYTQQDTMDYTVRYLEKDTNRVLHPPKTVTTTNAIVTEKFVTITIDSVDYAPDRYQKTLVLSTEGNNEIIFYYSASATESVYLITHYIQSADGTYYSVYGTPEDGTGAIGSNIQVAPKSITGFAFNRATVNGVAKGLSNGQVVGQIQKEGLSIELYYDRIEYQYTICYVDISNPSK